MWLRLNAFATWKESHLEEPLGEMEEWGGRHIPCVYSFGYFPGVKFDAGEISKRIHTIFNTRRKFEIK
jgi:hypothetical protein